MLTVENLSFRYRRRTVPVLRRVSLEMPDGEIGILMGRNGSGKTTLLKIILGLYAPEGGTVRFDGEDLLRMPRRERARRLAYVPQDIRFGGLRVYDTVLMGRMAYFGLRPGRADRAAAERVLREMGLTAAANRDAGELSGGERQKLAVARALAQEPRLLVFDEPTANLDMANERLLLSEAKKLAREKGVGILCTVHDLNQALSFGDRFFFLKDGVLRYAGSREGVDAPLIREVFGVAVRRVEAEGRTLFLAE